ncbi:MAG: hypothetical protein GY771_07060 [bacterium]|nr:hypothetical protein [bacterium]
MVRTMMILGLLIGTIGCNSEDIRKEMTDDPGTECDSAENEGPIDYITDDGVRYSIYLWRYSNAIKPDEELEIVFQCYNTSDAPLDGPAVFGESKLSLERSDGTVVEAEANPLGVWRTSPIIEPGKSYGPPIDISQIFELTELGDYVVRWDVAGGTAEFPIRIMEGPDYYIYRLGNDGCYNGWGIHIYGMDGHLASGLARETIALGDVMVPLLAKFLADDRGGFIEGSEDATIGSMFAGRVGDYAAIMIIEITGQDPGDIRSQKPTERDVRIDELKQWWEENKGDYR